MEKSWVKDGAIVPGQVELSGPSTLVRVPILTRIQGIASKCHVGLRVARLSLCVSTESEGGFSPGYVLLSFQILTPSSRQLPLTTPLELRSRLPCVQTRENPPYKGGCPKIGLDRRGGMNQNTPNPGLALRWPHPCSLPIEWGRRGCPPNVNLRPRVVLDAQVWLPARDGDGRCCHPSTWHYD